MIAHSPYITPPAQHGRPVSDIDRRNLLAIVREHGGGVYRLQLDPYMQSIAEQLVADGTLTTSVRGWARLFTLNETTRESENEMAISVKAEEFLGDCKRILSEREADAEPVYYLIVDDNDGDEDYCFDCVNQMFPDSAYGEHYAGGGSVWNEADGCRHCEKCGKLLRYVLTDYGVKEEIGHFQDSEWDWNNPNDCAHLARVAYGAFSDEDKRAVIKILKRGKNTPAALAKAYP